MGDLSYWDAQGQRLTASDTGRSVAAAPGRRTRSGRRPSRAVVRQLLALLDA
jgi:hypothetical protein